MTRTKDARPGMGADRGDDAAEVGVSARDSAGVHQHVFDYDLLLLVPGRVTGAGTINEHDRMDAAEAVIGLELQMEADAGIAVAPALTALEAHAHIIISPLLVINDSTWQSIVAHHIGKCVEQR